MIGCIDFTNVETPQVYRNISSFKLGHREVLERFSQEMIGDDLRCVIQGHNERGLSLKEIYKILKTDNCSYNEFDNLIENHKATFIVQKSEKYFGEIRDIREKIIEATGSNVGVSTFITPPFSRALNVHYDAVDVLVVQAAGSKKWKLYKPVIEKPNHRVPHIELDEHIKETLKFKREITLHEGDCLYLPRGWVHEVESEDNESIHLSCVIFKDTYLSVFTNMLMHAQEDLINSGKYRTSLAMQYIDEDHHKAKFYEMMFAFKENLESQIEYSNKALFLDYIVESKTNLTTIEQNKKTWEIISAVESESKCLISISDVQYRHLGIGLNNTVKLSTNNDNYGLVSKELWAVIRACKAILLNQLEERLNMGSDSIAQGLRVLVRELGICKLEEV